MHRVGWLAQQIGAELRGDPELLIDRVDTLVDGGPGAISFLANLRYQRYLATTKVSAVILAPELAAESPVAATLLCSDPHLGYARIAALLHPSAEVTGGRHPSAVVAADARIDPSAWIAPQVVIEEGVEIGPGCFIGPGSMIAAGVRIGRDCRLVARVTLCHRVWLGDRVVIHPGAVVGSDGFGFARSPEGWLKIPQLGSVRVEDDVEIGANTTIDRGAIRDTLLEKGVKLDNQIQIGHNVRIGEHSALAACVGISGSTQVGRNCTLGGGVGLAGHLEFGDNTHFTGQSLVTRSFREPGVYSGNLPALSNREWRKAVARFRHLDQLARTLRQLEQEVARLREARSEEQER